MAATSPALSQRLDSLATKLAAIQPVPTLPAPEADDEQTIAQIIRTLLGEAQATDDPEAADAPGAELMQILASLGIAPTTPGTGDPSTSDEAAVSPNLVRLSEQLTKLSAALADTRPELAQKLDAVATKLLSTDADPKLFAQLTSAASGPDGTALDRLVRSLIEANRDDKEVTRGEWLAALDARAPGKGLGAAVGKLLDQPAADAKPWIALLEGGGIPVTVGADGVPRLQ